MFAINLDNNNRVIRATFEAFADDKSILVEYLPEGDITDFKYIDGKFNRDPLPKEETPEPMSEPNEVEQAITDIQLAIAELYEMMEG